jgi:endonuclease I
MPFRSKMLVVLLAALTGAARAEAPVGYYDSATGTGSVLKGQLHELIDDQTVLSYGDARTLLQQTDADPDRAGHMLLVYSRESLDLSAIQETGSIDGWDSGQSWNREHTWPRSRGVDSSGPDNSDLHALRPSDPGINSSRSNLEFGGSFGQTFGRTTDGGTVYYPGDADAGMIARQMFYMAVRYDGSDSNTQDLELVPGLPTAADTLGNLDRLLDWHYLATPDGFEQGRNDKVFDLQGNRNPFVDRPEFVHAVFVDNANDSRLSLDGAAADADAATTLDVDFGAVIVGAALPASRSVTLNKSGFDGTYYRVETSGALTSGDAGRDAFAIGGPGSTTLELALTGSTADAGLITGQLTVDNLDVTTGGGPGVGDADGNDTVHARLAVLEHSNGSFAAAADQDTLSLAFGEVAQDTPGVSETFDLFNLAAGGSLTADLDLVGVTQTSNTGGAFSTDLTLFDALAAGDSERFTAFFDTSEVGSFTATYRLLPSDEDLPGAADGPVLTLNLSGTVVSVPEPSGLVILGGLTLVWSRRRRSARAA